MPGSERSTAADPDATTRDAEYERVEDTRTPETDPDADRAVHETYEERTTTQGDADPEVVREEQHRTERIDPR